jgi:hypothetical protein
VIELSDQGGSLLVLSGSDCLRCGWGEVSSGCHAYIAG